MFIVCGDAFHAHKCKYQYGEAGHDGVTGRFTRDVPVLFEKGGIKIQPSRGASDNYRDKKQCYGAGYHFGDDADPAKGHGNKEPDEYNHRDTKCNGVIEFGDKHGQIA